ncbi:MULTISPECIES: phosphohistidine phosphatase SixA [Alteromonadaceae]|uniref:phosphohistidine phosphatase SixA n=1 Tax=Alteromonadaceae TaxID=72275 RepID=UPI001C08E4B7|nr:MULTISPECIES: phosphohistidine phosphatase SixA [Aliiglaciecola]MBU2878052.1 phosphohistidine phosphatase SixA [Aliiglaciecola lipolytica]MDO6709417.1 phosphohistidine phosphatase SixA [Aliiglaciecola sp. 2_MG-2023]MDO6750565.1 phosphohistidine phosphatase SixA [Aliiglaciecola sp. 1_MG-2023]
MYIFVMRHGEAKPSLQNDQLRPLNDYGISQAKQSGNWLQSFAEESKVPLSHAMVSPFVRAQQTFQQVNLATKIVDIRSNSDLVPSGNCQALHYSIDQFAEQHPNVTGLLLVSHMPFVSYLVDEMCEIDELRMFSTGTIVCIDYNVEESKGHIVKTYTPK